MELIHALHNAPSPWQGQPQAIPAFIRRRPGENGKDRMSALQIKRLYSGKPIHTGNPYLEASITDMGATLALQWLGEPVVQIPAQVLRMRCQCDTCRSGKGNHPHPANPTTIAHIRPLGLSGLRIRFSDGHDAATYDWTSLGALSG
jgi:DUF971 family protein